MYSGYYLKRFRNRRMNYVFLLKIKRMETSILAVVFKKYASWLVLPVLMAVLVVGNACDGGDDEVPLTGTKYSISDIAGSWEASSATIADLTGAQHPFVDIIGEGGSLTLSIQSNGRFTLTIKRPGRADETFTGDMGFDEEWLAVRFDGDAADDYSYMFIDLNDPKNFMIIRGETEYDFDEDGNDETASIDLELDRV